MVKRVIVAWTIAFALMPARAQAHPLHTTITELTEDRAHGTMRATIRVFEDDFGIAVRNAARNAALPATGPQWDAASLAYVASVFAMRDVRGHALPLQSCGVKRTANLLWICVEAKSVDGLATAQIRNAMLCDRFDDQVNVVQGTIGGARKSLLFVRGNGFKPIA